MQKIIMAVTLLLASSFGYAAQGSWTEGYGQGNLEYFIDQDGMRLYIGCPTKDGSADAESSVTLQRISNDREVKQFTLVVGGYSVEGPFQANSRVGDNNFLALLKELRKADAVVKYEGKMTKFPKSNAAKILPVFGKGFSCNLSM